MQIIKYIHMFKFVGVGVTTTLIYTLRVYTTLLIYTKITLHYKNTQLARHIDKHTHTHTHNNQTGRGIRPPTDFMPKSAILENSLAREFVCCVTSSNFLKTLSFALISYTMCIKVYIKRI